MAKLEVVVEVVFVDDDSIVDFGRADTETLLALFFLAILNSAKFFRVSLARLSWCSLSLPSLSICRFRNSVVGEARSCSSVLTSGGVIDGLLRGFGRCSVYTSR